MSDKPVQFYLSERENKVAQRESTKLGMSKLKYCKRMWKKAMIREGLLKRTDADVELGL